MRIAVTADAHLTSRDEHPGRYKALENILVQAVEEEVETIIIAGDLFDASRQVYADFEALCQDSRFGHLRVQVIPGNHDPDIRQGDVVAPGLDIITEPRLTTLDEDGLEFLFIPYEDHKTMGEQIALFADRLTSNRWVLVGHGDWAEGLQTSNPYERGVYMPLTRKDVELFQPTKAFLGHIHLPLEHGRVLYPGSPYPVDISETGYRRFLLFDTETFEVESRRVDTDVIYFDEHLVVLPVEDEKAFAVDQASRLIEQWSIDDADGEKVQVRVNLSGYSANRRALADIVKKAFSRFRYYRDEAPDISGVRASSDIDRHQIARKARAWIEGLDWLSGPGEPGGDDVLLAALHIIYGK